MDKSRQDLLNNLLKRTLSYYCEFVTCPYVYGELHVKTYVGDFLIGLRS
jgi:hypothetical protein